VPRALGSGSVNFQSKPTTSRTNWVAGVGSRRETPPGPKPLRQELAGQASSTPANQLWSRTKVLIFSHPRNTKPPPLQTTRQLKKMKIHPSWWQPSTAARTTRSRRRLSRTDRQKTAIGTLCPTRQTSTHTLSPSNWHRRPWWRLRPGRRPSGHRDCVSLPSSCSTIRGWRVIER
jgi:hypothetical protein